MYYLYILRCADNSFYTGIAVDIDKRIKVHESGKGSKYVRARLPVTPVYKESFENKSEALKRELQVKRMSRKEKELLIQSH